MTGLSRGICATALTFFIYIHANALTLNDCPCSNWPAGTCQVSEVVYSMDNPNPQGDRGRDDLKSAEIRFIFDKPYTIGCYANGYDVWVLDPGTGVQVTGMTPAYDSVGRRHGAAVDFGDHPDSFLGDAVAKHLLNEPFDGNESSYHPAQNVTAPLLQPTQKGYPVSLTKMISVPAIVPSNGSYTKYGATLTAVAQIPSNNGANVFRPAWMGVGKRGTKPQHLTDNLRWDLIPNMSSDGISNIPTDPTKFLRWCRTTAYDMMSKDNFAYVTPYFNLTEYGTDNNSKYEACPLTAFLDVYGEATEKDLIIATVQQGLDLYHALKFGRGTGWPGNAGYSASRMFPVVFAAVMLNDQEMKNAFQDRYSVSIGGFHNPGVEFAEDGHLYYGRDNRILWGEPIDTDPWAPQADLFTYYLYGASDYWNLYSNSSSFNVRDPLGYIDGGNLPGQGYQMCCSTGSFLAVAIASYLIPETVDLIKGNMDFMGRLQPGQKLFDYVERWMAQGTWTMPDPCTKQPASGGTDCVTGSGRFPELHGTHAGTFGHGLSMATSIYQKYKSCLRTTKTHSNGQVVVDQYLLNCPGMVEGGPAPIKLSIAGQPSLINME
jgi:hypothetical protein